MRKKVVPLAAKNPDLFHNRVGVNLSEAVEKFFPVTPDGKVSRGEQACYSEEGISGLPLGGVEQCTLEGLGSVSEGDDDDVRQCRLDGHEDLFARDKDQPGRGLEVRHIGSLEIIAPRLFLAGLSG